MSSPVAYLSEESMDKASTILDIIQSWHARAAHQLTFHPINSPTDHPLEVYTQEQWRTMDQLAAHPIIPMGGAGGNEEFPNNVILPQGLFKCVQAYYTILVVNRGVLTDITTKTARTRTKKIRNIQNKTEQTKKHQDGCKDWQGANAVEPSIVSLS